MLQSQSTPLELYENPAISPWVIAGGVAAVAGIAYFISRAMRADEAISGTPHIVVVPDVLLPKKPDVVIPLLTVIQPESWYQQVGPTPTTEPTFTISPGETYATTIVVPKWTTSGWPATSTIRTTGAATVNAGTPQDAAVPEGGNPEWEYVKIPITIVPEGAATIELVQYNNATNQFEAEIYGPGGVGPFVKRLNLVT